MFEIVGNCLVGEIAQAIVVAIVSDLSGKFRLGAQRVLPLIGEQTIEFGPSRFECWLGGLGKEWDDESCGERNNHERCLQEADLHNIIIIICVYEDTSSENIRKARSVGFGWRRSVNGADRSLLDIFGLAPTRMCKVMQNRESLR